MCHLTEIPPMRRIDLQPDVRGQKCAMLCGPVHVWLAGSVGADPRNSRRCPEFRSRGEELRASRGEIYLLPRPPGRVTRGTEKIAINIARRIDDRYCETFNAFSKVNCKHVHALFN